MVLGGGNEDGLQIGLQDPDLVLIFLSQLLQLHLNDHIASLRDVPRDTY